MMQEKSVDGSRFFVCPKKYSLFIKKDEFNLGIDMVEMVQLYCSIIWER